MATTGQQAHNGRRKVRFNASDGTPLGAYDLHTRQPIGVNLARAEEFYAALNAWRDQHPIAPTSTDKPRELIPSLAPPPPEQPAPQPTRPRLSRGQFGPRVEDPAQPAPQPSHVPNPPPTRADPRAPDPRPRLSAGAPGDWVDLADNAPGQSAAAVAAQLRRQSPISTFLSRLFGLRTDERAWRIGAAGKRKTAHHLRRLVAPGCGWHVLHAVPVGTKGADIDHVLIGPAGIFTVNTKHHPRSLVAAGPRGITVNRHPTLYADKATVEAQCAGRVLGAALGGGPLHVFPVIAVVGAGVRPGIAPGGVVVIEARKLTHWLRKLPAILSEEAVTKLYAVARRSDTWQP